MGDNHIDPNLIDYYSKPGVAIFFYIVRSMRLGGPRTFRGHGLPIYP